MLRRIITITVLSAAMAFAVLFPLSNHAYAATRTYPSQTTGTAGAKATCSLMTWGTRIHDDHAQITCDLKDTKADGHSVYVEWWQDGFGHVELRNSEGSGHTRHVVDARQNGDGSFEKAYFKVCEDIPHWFDDCSDTLSWSPLI